jgi:hypothetical protein
LCTIGQVLNKIELPRSRLRPRLRWFRRERGRTSALFSGRYLWHVCCSSPAVARNAQGTAATLVLDACVATLRATKMKTKLTVCRLMVQAGDVHVVAAHFDDAAVISRFWPDVFAVAASALSRGFMAILWRGFRDGRVLTPAPVSPVRNTCFSLCAGRP